MQSYEIIKANSTIIAGLLILLTVDSITVTAYEAYSEMREELILQTGTYQKTSDTIAEYLTENNYTSDPDVIEHFANFDLEQRTVKFGQMLTQLQIIEDKYTDFEKSNPYSFLYFQVSTGLINLVVISFFAISIILEARHSHKQPDAKESSRASFWAFIAGCAAIVALMIIYGIHYYFDSLFRDFLFSY